MKLNCNDLVSAVTILFTSAHCCPGSNFPTSCYPYSAYCHWSEQCSSITSRSFIHSPHPLTTNSQNDHKLIQIHRHPPPPKSFVYHNCRTANNLDLFLIITETWLTTEDIIHQEVFKCTRVSRMSFTSFDHLHFILSLKDLVLILAIYRPPKPNSILRAFMWF